MHHEAQLNFTRSTESRIIFTPDNKKSTFQCSFLNAPIIEAPALAGAQIHLRLVGPTRRTQKRSFCCHLKLCSLKNTRWQLYTLKMLHRSILVALALSDHYNACSRRCANSFAPSRSDTKLILVVSLALRAKNSPPDCFCHAYGM